MDKKKINYKECQSLVSKICRDVMLSGWRPDYIVGITRGGLTPAVLISQYLNVKMETLKVSLRDSDSAPERNLWMAEDAFGYNGDTYDGDPAASTRGKNILIVDDINDSGATFNYIMEDWPSGCFPSDTRWDTIWNNNVRFAVLVDNLSSKCNTKMDYVGFEINKAEKDVWIDFPWEDWWTK